MNEFIRAIKDLLSIESNIYNDLLFDEEEDSDIRDEYLQLRTLFDKCKKESLNYTNKATHSAIKPIDLLLGLYSGPNILIAKRGDKLIDYEAALDDYQTKSNNGTPVPKEVHFEK